MTVTRRASRLVFLLAVGVPSGLASQSTAPLVLLGLVNDDAVTHPAFSWNGTEWQERTDDIPEGTPAVVVDSLGREFSARVGTRLEGLTWLFRLTGIDELIDRDRAPYWPPQPVGFATSPGITHAPFLPVESPLSVVAWERLLSEASPSADPAIPDELEVRVWTARAGNQSVTYFVVRRRPETRDCRNQYQFTGWVPPGTSAPIITATSTGDCDGKGLITRKPFGLVVPEGGHPTLAISIHDWETSGVELWELVDGQLQMRLSAWDT